MIARMNVQLMGLNPEKLYEIRDADSKKILHMTGGILLNKGLPLSIPKRRDSRLFRIKEVNAN